MSTAKSPPRGLKVPGVVKKIKPAKPVKPDKEPADAKAASPRAPEKPARRRPASRSVIREELVSKLRAAIAAGTYDTSDKLDAAVSRMMAEVFGSC